MKLSIHTLLCCRTHTHKQNNMCTFSLVVISGDTISSFGKSGSNGLSSLFSDCNGGGATLLALLACEDGCEGVGIGSFEGAAAALEVEVEAVATEAGGWLEGSVSRDKHHQRTHNKRCQTLTKVIDCPCLREKMRSLRCQRARKCINSHYL